jgi:hypothetical protein
MVFPITTPHLQKGGWARARSFNAQRSFFSILGDTETSIDETLNKSLLMIPLTDSGAKSDVRNIVRMLLNEAM